MLRRYATNLFTASSQWVNTLFGGDPDETLSSRAGKALRGPHPPLWARVIARVTHWFDPGHVADAIEEDEGRFQL